MKRCPECRRDYYDDTLAYCLEDGTTLVQGSTSLDGSATAILTPSAVQAGDGGLRESRTGGLRSEHLFLAIILTVLTTFAVSWLTQRYLRGDTRSNFGTYIVVPIGVDRPSLVYLTDTFAVAPDGSSVVFVKRGEGLYTRKRNQLAETQLPGAPNDAYAPVFSPDGKWIAFSSQNSLQKIPADGGTPEVLSRSSDYVINLTWGRDDVIRFPSKSWDCIRYVPAQGGQLQTLAFEPGIRVSRADWLPENRMLVSLTDSEGDFVGVRERDGSIRRLAQGFDAKLTPTNHLLYAKQDGPKWALVSVPLDINSATLSGIETVITSNVALRYATPAGATAAGDVFFIAGEVRSDRRLVILKRDGSERVLDGARGAWEGLRLSLDGSRLVLNRWEGARRTVWLMTLETGALTQVTYSDDDFGPVILPGTDEILHTQFPRNPGMYETTMWRVKANGSGEMKPLFAHPESYVKSTSPDGRMVYYESYEANDAAGDIFALDLGQDPIVRTTIMETPADEGDPLASPDGKWLAYTTDASGSRQVRLTSLTSSGNSTEITVGGGDPIRWSNDSKKLYYREGNTVAIIDIGTSGPSLSSRRTIFQLPRDAKGFVDVFPDGERVIMIRGGPMYSDLVVKEGAL
jgi:Tol biopolymer transport system component